MSNESGTQPRRKGRGFFASDVNQFERIRALNRTAAIIVATTDAKNTTAASTMPFLATLQT